MADIIYRHHKLGNIKVSHQVINRMYCEARWDMTWANYYNPKLENDWETENQIIENLFNGNYEKAQKLLDDYYSWVR